MLVTINNIKIMIVIHVDTMEDTTRLKKTYEGLENVTLLYNPTKEEVVAQLKRDDDPLVMCLGHGTTSGLFGTSWLNYVVDRSIVDLLKDRKVIGIWCFARSFAERYGLQGYFTSMFVSNWDETYSFPVFRDFQLGFYKCLNSSRISFKNLRFWVSHCGKQEKHRIASTSMTQKNRDPSLGFLCGHF